MRLRQHMTALINPINHNFTNHFKMFRDRYLIDQIRFRLKNMKFMGLVDLIYPKYPDLLKIILL